MIKVDPIILSSPWVASSTILAANPTEILPPYGIDKVEDIALVFEHVKLDPSSSHQVKTAFQSLKLQLEAAHAASASLVAQPLQAQIIALLEGLRTDVQGLTTQVADLTTQITDLSDRVGIVEEQEMNTHRHAIGLDLVEVPCMTGRTLPIGFRVRSFSDLKTCTVPILDAALSAHGLAISDKEEEKVLSLWLFLGGPRFTSVA